MTNKWDVAKETWAIDSHGYTVVVVPKTGEPTKIVCKCTTTVIALDVVEAHNNKRDTKLVRHPILDDYWTFIGSGLYRIINHRQQLMCNISGLTVEYTELLVDFPDLLRALEAYTNIKSDDNWEKVCAVIEGMGLCFTPG